MYHVRSLCFTLWERYDKRWKVAGGITEGHRYAWSNSTKSNSRLGAPAKSASRYTSRSASLARSQSKTRKARLSARLPSSRFSQSLQSVRAVARLRLSESKIAPAVRKSGPVVCPCLVVLAASGFRRLGAGVANTVRIKRDMPDQIDAIPASRIAPPALHRSRSPRVLGDH